MSNPVTRSSRKRKRRERELAVIAAECPCPECARIHTCADVSASVVQCSDFKPWKGEMVRHVA